jgi:tRNA pseudouridine38-40 synthase
MNKLLARKRIMSILALKYKVSYTLLVAYDGTAYHGWQIQPHCSTVAGMLQHRFQSVFHRDVFLQGASRTDAGVHALGQVVQATTDVDLEPTLLQKAWNAHLPKDIHIRSLGYTPEGFHPLDGVVQKTYYYHFFLERPLPFGSRYGLACSRTINLTRLQEALEVFVGTHNFRSFCTGHEQESTIRTIDAIYLTFLKRWRMYRIVFLGKSFLRFMIRRIVGAALDYAARPALSCNNLMEALAACNPQQHFTTAQPQGLLLRKIIYHKDIYDTKKNILGT